MATPKPTKKTKKTRLPLGTLVEQISSTLRDEILCGHPPSGQKIASEWDLVARFGVTRVAVREAISRLRAIGLVRARRGSGVEVLDWRREGGIELVPALLRLAGTGSEAARATLAQLLALRRAIGADLLVEAARRRPPEGIDALRAAVAEGRRAVKSGTSFLEADMAFARALTGAAGNEVALLLVNSIAHAIADPEVAAAMYAEPAKNLAGLEAALAAVEAGAVAGLADLGRAMLEEMDTAVLARLAAGRPGRATERTFVHPGRED